ARRFQINIQPQLVLLQKTLLSIEGLSHSIAPDLDLWASAAPQIERWLKKQIGVRAFFRRLRDNMPLWSEQLPEIPSMIYEVLKEKKIQQERIRFGQLTANPEVERKQRESRLKLGYFVSGAVIAGVATSL